ncbi:N-acetyltransferase family protein [Actinoallomurus sp. CA-150999]|uniref:GNAT family N-acetyltransferase n=1 Tax=Actinoallomurus sp. CA-150999 TaxID=3239887 RepID=UPI003D8E6968
MTDITIRPARPEDLEVVAELRWQWVEELYGTSGTPLDEFVPRFAAWAKENRSSHQCLVMARGDVVIGMAWLVIVQRVPHPRVFERASGDVQCVYMLPEERNGGLGGRLIDAVLALGRDLGLERVTVHSSDQAISAYSRHGFTSSPRLLQADVRQSAG